MAALELVEQSKTDALGLDRDMLWKLAEEVKVGNDKLFEENKSVVLNIYDRSNASMQKQYDSQHQAAVIEQ